MKKDYVYKLLIMVGCFFWQNTLHALEPLESFTEVIAKKETKRLLEKFDLNRDGKIHKSEDNSFWKKNEKFDRDSNFSLDTGELYASFFQSMDTPGEKLLNVCYKNTPQGRVYLDIFYPDEDIRSDKPVVFFTHGGGWAAGNKSKASTGLFAKVHKAWLKEGFVVVSVGYRLVNNKNETAIRDCVIDCKDAMRFVSAHHEAMGVDPNQFYTFGDSAGGHLAMMLLYTSSEPELFVGDPILQKYVYKAQAGVSWYGPCDFQDIQLFNHDDRPGFYNRFADRITGGEEDSAKHIALYKEVSPIVYMTEFSPALLMIQGDKDTTIPVKQAYRMGEVLEKIPAPTEIMIINNAGHNWRSVDAAISPTKDEITARTIDFLIQQKK